MWVAVSYHIDVSEAAERLAGVVPIVGQQRSSVVFYYTSRYLDGDNVPILGLCFPGVAANSQLPSAK